MHACETSTTQIIVNQNHASVVIKWKKNNDLINYPVLWKNIEHHPKSRLMLHFRDEIHHEFHDQMKYLGGC